MFCPECGKKNEDNAKFCENCGKEINQIVKTEIKNKKTKDKNLFVVKLVLLFPLAIGLGIVAGAIERSLMGLILESFLLFQIITIGIVIIELFFVGYLFKEPEKGALGGLVAGLIIIVNIVLVVYGLTLPNLESILTYMALGGIFGGLGGYLAEK